MSGPRRVLGRFYIKGVRCASWLPPMGHRPDCHLWDTALAATYGTPPWRPPDEDLQNFTKACVGIDNEAFLQSVIVRVEV